MALLEYNAKLKKESKHQNRFYTSRDMAIVKKDIAIKNSEIKRGERESHGNEIISICGCGMEGCFLHLGFESVSKEENNDIQKRKRKHH